MQQTYWSIYLIWFWERLKAASGIIYIAGIKSEATSLANQKLLYKNGYRMLKEIKHSEYLDEYGRQIFKCDDGTDRIMLFYKRLVHK